MTTVYRRVQRLGGKRVEGRIILEVEDPNEAVADEEQKTLDEELETTGSDEETL